jgi:hypothetical protein
LKPWDAASAKRAARKARREAKKAEDEALNKAIRDASEGVIDPKFFGLPVLFQDAYANSAEADGTPRIPPPPKTAEGIARARGKKTGRPLGRKGLVKKLDDICSRVVRQEAAERTGGRCELAHISHAGCAGIQNVFHIFSRAKYSVRWDRRNLLGTCFSSNNLFEHDCDFIHQVVDWFKKSRGEDFYDTLKRDSNRTAKLSNADLWAMVDKFNAELKQEDA